MSEDEIDRLWARCTEEAIKAHEPFTKFRFAAAIRDAALEEAAVICEQGTDRTVYWAEHVAAQKAKIECAAVIRAKKGARHGSRAGR